MKSRKVTKGSLYDLPKLRSKGEPNRKKPKPRKPQRYLASLLVILLVLVGVIWWQTKLHLVSRVHTATKTTSNRLQIQAFTGKVSNQSEVISYSSEQVKALIRQTNHTYQGTPPALKSQIYAYNMTDTNGASVLVYARVFIPVLNKGAELPVFAFAPGTTGIDDQCAASLENPSKRNWANYASLMASYAVEGYVAVMPDYEGMRDNSRIHHYMVGALEGRTLLDAARSVKNLSLTQDLANTDQLFLAGYSQGGHAAFWADKLAPNYAPDLTIKGVIGFGPVTDVKETLTDTTKGANILWFGPYLLHSYADWYQDSYDLSTILQPPFDTNLAADIAKNCIDTNIQYWGNKDINKVYTPAFIQAMRDGTLAQFSPRLQERMIANMAGDTKTSSQILINQGKLDNVILPVQSEAAKKRLCVLGNSVTFRLYPDATHYNTMVKSFSDTINWMKAIRTGSAVPRDCSAI